MAAPEKQLVILGNNLTPAFRDYFNALAAEENSGIEIIPASIGVFNGNHYELETNQEAFAQLWYKKAPTREEDWPAYMEEYEAHKEELRGRHVVFIQSMSGNTGRHIEETSAMASALKEAKVGSYELFVPYLPYGRQDKHDKGRIGSLQGKYYPIRLKNDGWSKVTGLEVHSDKAQEYYTEPEAFGPDNAVFISPAQLYAEDMRRRGFTPENTVMLAPDGSNKPDDAGQRRAHDAGRAFYNAARFTDEEEARYFAKLFKDRTGGEKAGTSTTKLTWESGDVAGKHCVIVDDVGDSLGTIGDAAQMLREHGALSVSVYLSYQGGDTGRLEDALFKRNFNGNPLVDHITFLDACPVINKHIANLAGMTYDDGSPKYPGVRDRISILSSAPLFAQQLQTLKP